MIKVTTTQWCAVWDAVGGAEHSNKIGDIAGGQDIGVEEQFNKRGDLLDYALVVWPENLHPYLATGKNGYVDRKHYQPTGTPTPGNATLNGIMSQCVNNGIMLDKIMKHFGIT